MNLVATRNVSVSQLDQIKLDVAATLEPPVELIVGPSGLLRCPNSRKKEFDPAYAERLTDIGWEALVPPKPKRDQKTGKAKPIYFLRKMVGTLGLKSGKKGLLKQPDGSLTQTHVSKPIKAIFTPFFILTEEAAAVQGVTFEEFLELLMMPLNGYGVDYRIIPESTYLKDSSLAQRGPATVTGAVPTRMPVRARRSSQAEDKKKSNK